MTTQLDKVLLPEFVHRPVPDSHVWQPRQPRLHALRRSRCLDVRRQRRALVQHPLLVAEGLRARVPDRHLPERYVVSPLLHTIRVPLICTSSPRSDTSIGHVCTPCTDTYGSGATTCDASQVLSCNSGFYLTSAFLTAIITFPVTDREAPQ